MKIHFNVTEAARRMHKSQGWLSQRLNKCKVNGKEVDFTPKELQRLIEIVGDLMQSDMDALRRRKERLDAKKKP